MSDDKKGRRANGDGSVYKQKSTSKFWTIAYCGPDGKRIVESSRKESKDEATALLRKRVGARENNLPVVANAEQFTLREALDIVLDDMRMQRRRSVKNVERRINKHLLPYFGLKCKMVTVTTAQIRRYILHRQDQWVVSKKGTRVRKISDPDINRDLQILTRAFKLAVQEGHLGLRPHVPMLPESIARSGFFEQDQMEAVVRHLPEELRPAVRFAYITGWRMKSEVFPLEWRRVDFTTGEVRLDPGTAKNGEARTFVMTTELRTLLEEQDKRRRETGQIVRWVFFRMVAKGRRGPKSPKPITSITKAWKNACLLAGCPGRIPHDFRRTAVRNLDRAGVPRSVAMRMVGHKTESIYERYRIVDNQDLRDAAARLDAVAGVVAKQA